MSEPFIGELRTFAFGITPKGWMPCNGQLLPINSNQALYSLLGTLYGGNGTSTFGLPNLQGRVALSAGSGSGGIGSYTQGQTGGSATVALSGAQVPSHIHSANGASASASTGTPGGGLLPGVGTINALPFYNTDGSQLGAMAANALANSGGGQSHSNVQPSLALNICIAIVGIFPSRN